MEIHIHIHHHGDNDISEKLDLIIHQNKKIIMTQAEATQALNDLTAQVGKVKTEVEKLIAAVQNAGNVTPELQTAIENAKTALQGVDDLNPDESTGEPTP